MYALITNQQVEKYPYSIGQLRKDNPQVSFPKNPSDAVLASYGVLPVATAAQPSFDPATQKVAEGTPADIAGQWTQVWNVTQLTADEIAAQQLALQDAIVAQTQQRLDDFAKTRNYDGILSACTYATSTVPKFASEGQLCVEYRDATWAKLYDILGEVERGERDMPKSFSDIEEELPSLEWK